MSHATMAPRLVLGAAILTVGLAVRYEPNWNSLDGRPLPAWYDAAKFGIFAHWGVYAVPAYHSEWFWYYWRQSGGEYDQFVNKHFGNGTTYAEFAPKFTAEDFDANKFADIIKASGARYFVLTSKHHEGFTLWPSARSWNWNSVDVGAHVDLVAALAKSIRGAGLHFGTYFSLMDWFHPLYLSDKTKNDTEYAQTVALPQLLELVRLYQPDVIWSDGDWEVSDKYWRSEEFLAWLYNDSPIKDSVVVNDRWGSGTVGQHGGFLTHSDEFDPGVLMPRKWENCLKLDSWSWGYRRNIRPWDVLSVETLIGTLARTISCGGNLLLNIGPDRTGLISPIFEERLRRLGDFVNANQEAIFGTRPWIHQNESSTIWYTSRLRRDRTERSTVFNVQNEQDTVIYAFVVAIPRDNLVRLQFVTPTNRTKVSLVGTSREFSVSRRTAPLLVNLTEVPEQDWPYRDAIVLKIEYAASDTHNPLRGLSRRTVVLEATDTRASNSPYARFHAKPAAAGSQPAGRRNPDETRDPNRTASRGSKSHKGAKSSDASHGDEALEERNFFVASNFK